MKILSFVAIFMVCCVVFVGAFNVVYGVDNRPMSFYEILTDISTLNVNFEISTDTIEQLKEHFESLNDDTYKLRDDYVNASFFEKLFEDWKHNSIVIRIVSALFFVLEIVFSFIIDVLRIIVQLLTLGYRLVRGVPV